MVNGTLIALFANWGYLKNMNYMFTPKSNLKITNDFVNLRNTVNMCIIVLIFI